MPEPKATVTEYRQMHLDCPCGYTHSGAFPPSLTPNVSYGPRLKAYAVGLAQGHFVGLEPSFRTPYPELAYTAT